MAFDAVKTTNNIIDWIKTYFINNAGPDTKAVIGISGGKDSLIAAALCVRALGPERVFGVMMPNGTQADIADSRATVAYLGIPHTLIDIGDTVSAHYESIKDIAELNDAILTNVPARVRMMTLYSVAASIGGRVVNTSNYSEKYVGYSTKWGDGVGDFSPLGSLTVSEVLQIGEVLDLPRHLLYKAPSDGMTGKTDEDILGFTYKEVDEYIRENKIPEDVDVYRSIVNRHETAKHKINDIPVFITSHRFLPFSF